MKLKTSTGIITLNRPNALNALNLNMAVQFSNQLREWENNNKIKIKNLNSFKKLEEPVENGNNFFDNAKIKSKYGFEKLNLPCFADDSGFCVEALNNDPGVKSKRYHLLI